MILHILLLFSIYVVLCFGSSCKPSDCNHAGECIGSNPTCKCFSNKYFIGNKCQQMVDNCQPNPCKGGPCKTLVGGYSCTANFNVVKEWYIHSNLYGNYGEEQKMILAFKELDDWNRAIEITTDNYFIDGFEANPSNNDKYFKYSSDLMSIAEGLGLHHTDKFPFNSGYYHITQANFWIIGKRDVDIIISVNDEEYFFYRTLEFYVLQPEEISCIPDVTFPHCMDPYDPIFLDIKRFNIFEPEILETCGKDAAYTFRWWTFDSTETILLHFFGRTNETRLRVPPYRLWFGSHFEITMGYVVRFEFRSSVEDSCVARVARCYFKVYPEPISGKIAGGEEREVGVRQTFRLDGSKSRDFALAPNVEQKMIFRWDCSSDDDPTNSYCQDNIGTKNPKNPYPYFHPIKKKTVENIAKT
ncbi:uncharacterized protein LOC119687230 [Teleopsis dalmanni]|uniref:uncharacterized protein LOC119687230 n=1 Tax=Teleopsis dalmanni TaxID=139649 RepID=UPI0018CD3DAF|nr:uncharacterized protein LOC119687230 [Teleopsis dalmanni]